jgi:hypothetical protein
LLRFLDSKTNRKLYLFKNINVNEWKKESGIWAVKKFFGSSRFPKKF